MPEPSQLATISTDVQPTNTNWTSIDVSHTVDTSTDMLVVSVNTLQSDTTHIDSVIWDSVGVNEALTLVHRTTGGGDSGDHKSETWALVSPTVKTANITLSESSAGSVNLSSLIATNWKDVDTTSVAAATNFVEESVNNAPVMSATFTGGGTAGNLQYMFFGWRGQDTDPFNRTNAWTTAATNYGSLDTSTPQTIIFVKSGGGGGATVSAQATDEMAGHIIEFVAGGGGISPLGYYHLRYNT